MHALSEVGVDRRESGGYWVDGSPTGNTGPTSARARAMAVEAAARFSEVAQWLDKRARGAGRSLPTQEENHELLSAFWHLVEVLERDGTGAEPTLPARQEVRAVVKPWLLRSRFWNRVLLNPHVRTGDFQLLEWIYDLEGDSCMNPGQPAISNALDGIFSSVQSLSGNWFRRAWCRELMLSMIDQLGRPLRVLDVGCAGSRYTRDVVGVRPGSIRLAGVDEDPAALDFIRSRLPANALDRVGLISAPLDHWFELVPVPTWPEAGFDLVLSSTLFEDIDNGHAEALLLHMLHLTRPGGVTAICNSSPVDRSRVVKDWLLDWQTVYRGTSAVRLLFPADRRAKVEVSSSPNAALVCARAVK